MYFLLYGDVVWDVQLKSIDLHPWITFDPHPLPKSGIAKCLAKDKIVADCRRHNGFTLRFHRGLP
jgi:hypothetical protein